MLRLRSHSDFIAFGEKSLTGASVSADQVTYSNIFMIKPIALSSVIYPADNTIHLSNNWRQMATYVQNKWTSVYEYPSTLIWFLWRKFKGAAIVASPFLYDILPPTSHQSLPLTPRPPIPHHFFWHLTCVQSSRYQPHVRKYGDCLTTLSKPRIFVLTLTLLEFFSCVLI